MIEICWRYDPDSDIIEHHPSTAAEAATLLAEGNAGFASIGERDQDTTQQIVLPVAAADLGFGGQGGAAPTQTPFAAVLGCADARVPPELVFFQSANDLFTVRVAGNVPGTECVGSLDYAVAHLPSLRLVTVVGHTGCGAVSAAVDAHLDPTGYLGLVANLPLRAIVDALMATVRGAEVALVAEYGPDVVGWPGYRAALLDVAVILNAATTAQAVEQIFSAHLGEQLGVTFGVYDLVSRRVGLPSEDGHGDLWQGGLAAPPGHRGFRDFVDGVTSSPYVLGLLDAGPTAGH